MSQILIYWGYFLVFSHTAKLIKRLKRTKQLLCDMCAIPLSLSSVKQTQHNNC